MQTEIEAKFLAIDHSSVRAKLRDAGAVCEQPMRLMRRKTYDYPNKSLNKKNGWVRVRDEGDKITMSYKQLNDRTVHGTQEVNLVIDSFDAADWFLVTVGLVSEAYQETKRESWVMDGVQIELDEWPWIKPFVEIEGPSERAVREVAAKLGLDWSLARHGSVENAYQAEYDVTEEEVDSWPEITFTPVPEWLEERRRK
jgi:adenylate cyclase class 2